MHLIIARRRVFLNKAAILLAAFLLFFSVQCAAQFLPNPNYVSYNIEDGLSNSMVHTISQDGDGYMWFGTEDGLNRFDGQTFHVYRNDPKNVHSLAGNRVNQVYLADDNTLWIATRNGLSQYHKNGDNFTSITVASGLSHNNVQSVLKVEDTLWLGTDNGLNIVDLNTQRVTVFPVSEDGQGTSHKWIRALAKQGNYIWVATWGGGLNRYDLTLKRFEYFRHNSQDKRSLSTDTVYSVLVSKHNDVWVGTVQGGLNRFEPTCECFERHTPNKDYQKTTVASLAESNSALWVANDNGLSKRDYKTRAFSSYSMLKPHELGNITRDVRSVFISRDDTIWLGSFQGGIIAIPANGFSIQTYAYSEQAQNSLMSDDINSLLVDQGYLWTGSVGGLYRYPITQSGALGAAERVIDTFTLKIEPANNGSYWLATNRGLYHLNADLTTLSYNDHTKLILDNAGEGAVLDVVETRSGRVFVANWRGGLTQVVDEHLGVFKRVGFRGDKRGINANTHIYSMVEGRDDQLWIGTTDGVNRYDIELDKIHHYSLQFNHNQPPVTVYYVFVDGDKLYLGTSNGLYEYEESSDTFTHFSLPLKSHYIQAIVKDADTALWLSTFNGLYRWNKITNHVDAFFKRDGLQSSEFNTKGVVKGDDGTLYFAGIDGVSRIIPSRLKAESSNATLRWLVPENYPLSKTTKNTSQHTQASTKNDIELQFTQSADTISLDYFVDDFYRLQRRQFRYRLNKEAWVEVGNAMSIQLSGLATGTYDISLQYSNDGKQWRSAHNKMLIDVEPPPYQSNIALMMYGLLLLLVGFAYYRFRTHALLKQKVQLQQRIDEKTAELAATLAQKNQLFANISHELRTPITLINAPIEQLAQDANLSEQQKKLIHLIQNNGKRLFGLVERILHLSKIEQKEKHIEPINIDDLLIRYVIAFEPLMQQKEITLQRKLDSHAIVNADKEDLISILENLLSNALKYTSTGGWVKLHSRIVGDGYQLSIENKHAGLSPEQIGKIFNRFERLGQSDSEQGFGLGLSLVLDICRQNSWDIHCESRDASVLFTLTIDDFAIETNNVTPAHRQILALGVSKTSSSHQQRQSLLIVEDNDELRGFLTDILSSEYKVSSAENGAIGLEYAIENIPDLIISDVMMPKMDGFSLVKALSEHDNTSHIPTILLTAKVDEESELKGLELGAIDYIAKPFEARQLLLKVSNTLARQKLRFKAKQTQDEPVENIISERDQKFITRLNDTVERRYTDSEFNVEQLVDAVAMSERQLQRKLKALFNQTPAEYIRNFRLVKAKALLLEGKSISLTSDLVGFNSSSYFSRSFKSAFGQSPKDFIAHSNK